MSAEQKHPLRPRRRLWILVLIALLIVVQLLCDPFSLLLVTAEKVVLRIQLVQARRRWDNAAIVDYDLTVSGYTPLTCIVQEEPIRVRGGEPQAAAAGYPEWCQVPRSMPQAFDAVEAALDGDWRVQARFDPQYGTVSELRFNCNYGHALLTPIGTDCTGGFQIDSFTPLAGP